MPPVDWSDSGVVRTGFVEAQTLGLLDLNDPPFVDDDLHNSEAQRTHVLAHQTQPMGVGVGDARTRGCLWGDHSSDLAWETADARLQPETQRTTERRLDVEPRTARRPGAEALARFLVTELFVWAAGDCGGGGTPASEDRTPTPARVSVSA